MDLASGRMRLEELVSWLELHTVRSTSVPKPCSNVGLSGLATTNHNIEPRRGGIDAGA